MLRDPKLSRCATLVECVCVNVSRGFEFFFFNVTSLTFAVARKVFLLSNSVLRYTLFDYASFFLPVVDDPLLFSRFSTHFFRFIFVPLSLLSSRVRCYYFCIGQSSQKRTGESDVVPGAKI